MSKIHHTAIVSPKAIIGENVSIAPFAVIYDDVEIGDNSSIGPHSVIYDGARIGKNVIIYQGASIAHVCQDLKFKPEPTICAVGDNTTIHEFVTLHRGSNETKRTLIGSNVLLMAYAHVAHDCVVGDNCILANGVQIGGFGEVDDWAIIGGCTPIHQFCKVGKHCMVGGAFRVVKDVPPFILAGEEPLKYAGLNSIGLRRRGFTPQQIDNIKKAYHIIYDSGLNVSQAKEKIAAEMSGSSEAQEILSFLNRCKRGIIGKLGA
ncbi:MAG: acyl-ACP--UDP-N-acetylglucosamine O-acyltransferase [Ignavibacteriaceae bacterium]|jgi:UDP-N-acetylglucosamine acyltransferase|nr:acyl-ACP--UDP-N-acetylglucosamine O-acyltransferase [Ignavibacteriaceae bacterium]